MGVLFIKLALLFSMSTKILHHDNIYQVAYTLKIELTGFFSVFPGLLQKECTLEAMCCENLTVDVIATEVVECLLAKAAIQLKAINAK